MPHHEEEYNYVIIDQSSHMTNNNHSPHEFIL